jgi:hypothetical protein
LPIGWAVRRIAAKKGTRRRFIICVAPLIIRRGGISGFTPEAGIVGFVHSERNPGSGEFVTCARIIQCSRIPLYNSLLLN